MKIIGKGWYTGPRNYNTGAGFGITTRKDDRDKYFKREWNSVILRLEGIEGDVIVNINKPSFWSKCPELIKKEIGIFFKIKGVINWRKGYPPKVELEQIKDNIFIVRLLK